jgi:hypothetical protein
MEILNGISRPNHCTSGQLITNHIDHPRITLKLPCLS